MYFHTLFSWLPPRSILVDKSNFLWENLITSTVAVQCWGIGELEAFSCKAMTCSPLGKVHVGRMTEWIAWKERNQSLQYWNLDAKEAQRHLLENKCK